MTSEGKDETDGWTETEVNVAVLLSLSEEGDNNISFISSGYRRAFTRPVLKCGRLKPPM